MEMSARRAGLREQVVLGEVACLLLLLLLLLWREETVVVERWERPVRGVGEHVGR